ncbi:YibE/F family protein [Paenibacillus psychroresistens]|uniref:YibE/F family protein n=1 Tax=Paenibacillus psychroresistens TaxID=1778678 RepID=A0A6B8RTN7_9BACL|nr:YibE/F family protein [Paenibacillus psychroresistens]QGQ99269.1 YibE/F family protein [Paenibacillus psychroresistens]
MLKSGKVRVVLFVLLLLLISLFMYLFNQSPEKTYNEQNDTSYTKYEKAKVLKVISEELEKDSARGDLYHGSQELEVKILSGEHKGTVHTITNNISIYLNVIVKTGQTIIVSVDTADAENYLVNVYSYYRAPLMFALILLFFAVLWGIGGKKGLKSVVGIVFTFASIIYLFIPMLYRGYSPILASVLIVVLTTCITLLLLNGWSSKSIAAILGTTIGVIIAGIIAYISGNLAHVSGYSTKEVEILIVVADDTGMQLKGLLFAGILLSSLGAIIDVGISIASSVYEVYLANTKLSKKELFLSGINVGRDMMGTMANTLLLAFTGTTLASLMILYASKVTFNQLTNMNMITIEVIQGITGCFGVVLTIPIVAFISSRVIPNFEKNPALNEKAETPS